MPRSTTPSRNIAPSNTQINQSTVEVCRLPRNLLFVVKHILLHSIDAKHVTIYSARAVTLSGLLNANSGVASQQSRLLIMTTNYVEKLDGVLIQAGLINVQDKLPQVFPFLVHHGGSPNWAQKDVEDQKSPAGHIQLLLSFEAAQSFPAHHNRDEGTTNR
ncbi:hypothetical protein LA080_004107 [Diaporthe eres]|nr:hypothetical protein LA080_004107 [Diaporthe eres]